jgi:ABC-type transport system involved in cytochrome bd biosynthesis fused ATPase/permease subunit
MKKWLTVHAPVELAIIVYTSIMITVGAMSWVFWVMLATAIILCGLRPDFAVMMIAATASDVCRAIKWLGIQTVERIQKVVDKVVR